MDDIDYKKLLEAILENNTWEGEYTIAFQKGRDFELYFTEDEDADKFSRLVENICQYIEIGDVN